MIDQYRIQLFKNKMRALVSEKIEGIRFGKSINGEFLFFDVHRYKDVQAVTDIFTRALDRENIQYEVRRDIFGFQRDRPIDEQSIWDIKIPIDQDALPERKR